MKTKILFCSSLLFFTTIFAQEEDDKDVQTQNNLVYYSPSKLLSKGQWDIKWFNNLYSETKEVDDKNNKTTFPRRNFFTSTLEAFTGIDENKKWNLGLVLELRSNTVGGQDVFKVFNFSNTDGKSRSGLTSFAPSLKFSPFKRLNNFSIQSSFKIPLIKEESLNDVFLSQKGYTWQNKFFYDHLFKNQSWQLFFELNTELNFGKKEESFANNSLRLSPGVFLSYFPRDDFTILFLAQHSQLLDLGSVSYQNYTALGGGIKHQLTTVLNIELLYTKFIAGNATGLGETFNLGLRTIF